MTDGRAPLRIRPPHVLLAVGTAGVFLPWATTSSDTILGLSRGDGFLILALGAATFLLDRSRIRWAWIVAGIAAAVAIRDVVRVLGVPSASVGIGLWITAAGFVSAAAWLLGELAVRIARAKPDSSGGGE